MALEITESINDILPEDIIQYILLFDGIYRHKRVNHKWNLLCNKNETILMRQIYKSFNQQTHDQQNTNKTHSNKITNNIFIIHPNRIRLNQFELTSGYTSIFNDLISVFNIIRSGDIILIHKGNYDTSLTWQHTIDNLNNITIIGLETDVIIAGNININNSTGITLKNLSFIPAPTMFNYNNAILGNSTGELLRVSGNSKLTVTECKFNFRKRGIMIEPSGSLQVSQSEFIGGSTAIQVSFTAKNIEVRNSKFVNCGHMYSFDKYSGEFGCILVYDNWFGTTARNNNHRGYTDLVRVKCIGNVFENNLCYTIAERHPPLNIDGDDGDDDQSEIIDEEKRYCLEENMLRGYNGKEIMRRMIEDANQVYFNDEPMKTPIFRFGLYL